MCSLSGGEWVLSSRIRGWIVSYTYLVGVGHVVWFVRHADDKSGYLQKFVYPPTERNSLFFNHALLNLGCRGGVFHRMGFSPPQCLFFGMRNIRSYDEDLVAQQGHDIGEASQCPPFKRLDGLHTKTLVKTTPVLSCFLVFLASSTLQ